MQIMGSKTSGWSSLPSEKKEDSVRIGVLARPTKNNNNGGSKSFPIPDFKDVKDNAVKEDKRKPISWPVTFSRRPHRQTAATLPTQCIPRNSKHSPTK